MRSVYRIAIIVSILSYCMDVSPQSSILVSHYNKSDYSAGNQNWDISLDNRGYVCFANNTGLLTFNGANWKINKLPGETIIRSVLVDSNRIYTGSFEEFGYWQMGTKSEREYVSLIPLLKDYTLHNDEIWKIVKHDKSIYFQSFGAIFRYDYKTIEPLKIPGLVLFLLEASGRLYVQQINGGLFEIKGNEFIPLAGSEIFKDTEVKSFLQLNDNEYIIGTSSRGLFRYDGKSFTEWKCEVSSELKEYKLNNGIRLKGRIAYGTILNGVYVLSLNGSLIAHLNADSSILNNTILALRSDKDDNLWVGMDKGIDYIAFNSPVDIYKEQWTAYSAVIHKGNLYLATNQGIYYFSIDSHGYFTNKRFLKGSQGQVWFLQVVDDDLYCGLNNGTYRIKEMALEQVSNISGGYNLKKTSHSDFMIQSTYSSIVLYSKKNNVWQMNHVMEGFMAPARFLETDYIGNIWLGHSIKGIYMIQPAGDYLSAASVKSIGSNEGLPENANKVFRIDNRIVVPTGNELYTWDDINNKMIPFKELNKQLEGFEKSISIVPLDENKYWLIRKNECAMFEIRFGKAKLLYRIIPEMYDLNLVENNENIIALNDSLNLICLDNGFAILNIYKLNRLHEVNTPPSLREIVFRKSDQRYNTVFVSDGQRVQIGNRFNDFSISFSSNEPTGKRKYYQYMLEGLESSWSDWSAKSEVSYTRLPAGSYSFRVRTLNSKGIITPAAVFAFRIRPPWFLSAVAYCLYFSFFVAALILLRVIIKRRFQKHKELLVRREKEKIRQQQEKAEQEIMRLSNENLEAEVTHKNSQLANSTMAIIKKNELLIQIGDELENLKEELGYRMPNKYYDRLKRLINQNIENERDWEIFENLFDQAHANFFKRLKTEYPSLTPSDLRLCAYLRMNLSSKEIGPLINITTRGVEERRYRLRKRLNLPPDQNLTEYILKY